MTQFISWMQSNWYGLGNLFFRFALLTAAVWFARGILRTLRSFQEQVGALLKLSIAAAPEVRNPSILGRHAVADPGPFWLTPSETQASNLPEPAGINPGRLRVGWHHFVQWLEEPMSTGESVPLRVIRWLRAPMAS